MSKLITAGFVRLFRLKSLYACLAVIAFQLIVNIVGESGQLNMHVGVTVTTDDVSKSAQEILAEMQFTADSHISEVSFLLMIAAAIVIGNLIGSEHGFGTMRNKLTVGHDRVEIYIANFIVSLSAVLMMLIFGWVLIFATALPLGAQVQSTADELITLFLLNVLYALVISALYVFIAMNVQSKSNILTASIVLGGVMVISNAILDSQLSQPEYMYPPDSLPVPNPYYISGTKRDVMEMTDTLLPCSAVLEYDGEFEAGKIIAETCETVIFTAAGLVIFRRIDLK